MADILVVEDDQSVATAFSRFLQFERHDFRVASTAQEGLRLLEERVPDLVLMDVRMPGMDGLQALEQMRSRFPDLYVVIMTAYGTSQTSIGAIRAGAFDYITKPLDLDQLRSIIDKALTAQRSRPQAKAGDDSAEGAGPPVLIGESPAMIEIYKMIGRLATTDAPALITGERGTGKRLVAATIHDHSARRAEPLVVADGASIRDVAAAIALLDTPNGTLHLMHVDEMPNNAQAALARSLADRRRAAAGSAGPRLLASSDADIAESLLSGAFNQELYDAIATVTLSLPPLRARRDDIPLLVRYFIQRCNTELNRAIKGVDDTVSRAFNGHAWPGNVGELERVIRRAAIIAPGDVMTAADVGDALSPEHRNAGDDTEGALIAAARGALRECLIESGAGSPFHRIVDLVETTLVKEALAITNGNQVKAADLLGVNRATLRKKI